MDTTGLAVTGFHATQDLPCLIKADEYIPLRFRTYIEALGAQYFRVGNHDTVFMEIMVDPDSNLLRGVTLVSLESFVPWPTIGEPVPVPGLPVFSIGWDERNRLDMNWIDIDCNPYLSFRGRELLIAWEDIASDSVSNVQFFVSNGRLAGIRFFDLTERLVWLLAAQQFK